MIPSGYEPRKPAITCALLRRVTSTLCVAGYSNTVEPNEMQDAAPGALMTKDVISLIKLLPDELPCHLAVLCRLNCRDVSPLPVVVLGLILPKVFAYRSGLFSSVFVSNPVQCDTPSQDPNPPAKSWFSGSV